MHAYLIKMFAIMIAMSSVLNTGFAKKKQKDCLECMKIQVPWGSSHAKNLQKRRDCFRRCDPCNRSKKLEDYEESVKRKAGSRNTEEAGMTRMFFENTYTSVMSGMTRGRIPADILSAAKPGYEYFTSDKSASGKAFDLYRGVAAAMLPRTSNPNSIGNRWQNIVTSVENFYGGLDSNKGTNGYTQSDLAARLKKANKDFKKKISSDPCDREQKLPNYKP